MYNANRLIWCSAEGTLFMYYVYLLKSLKDQKHYVGSTPDLKRRFKEHQNRLVTSTKTRGPWKLIYYEAYESLELARKREHSLKLKGKAYQQLYKRINIWKQ